MNVVGGSGKCNVQQRITDLARLHLMFLVIIIEQGSYY